MYKYINITVRDLNLKFKGNLIENDKNDISDEDIDRDEALEQLKETLPDELIYIGELENELFNGWHQQIKEEYYIIKLEDQEFNWALCRIYWDDNFESWEFSADVGLIGNASEKEASIYLLSYLWNSWGIELSEINSSPYTNLLKQLKGF
jgi:hypothetical protein